MKKVIILTLILFVTISFMGNEIVMGKTSDDLEVLAQKAISHEKKGNYEQARNCWLEYLGKLDPMDEESKKSFQHYYEDYIRCYKKLVKSKKPKDKGKKIIETTLGVWYTDVDIKEFKSPLPEYIVDIAYVAIEVTDPIKPWGFTRDHIPEINKDFGPKSFIDYLKKNSENTSFEDVCFCSLTVVPNRETYLEIKNSIGTVRVSALPLFRKDGIIELRLQIHAPKSLAIKTLLHGYTFYLEEGKGVATKFPNFLMKKESVLDVVMEKSKLRKMTDDPMITQEHILQLIEKLSNSIKIESGENIWAVRIREAD